MGRKENLYKRLDALEGEFAEYLLKELTNVAEGRISWFLSRKVPHLFDGKKWRNQEVADAERAEKEIIELREKLEEPVEGPMKFLSEYVEKERQLPDRLDGGDKHLAQQLISNVKEWQSIRHAGAVPR
jgi:hypothetical protein